MAAARAQVANTHLLLRPTTEADLLAVAATLSADIASNPQLPRFPGLDESTSRAVSAHQSYWQSVGNWSVDNWRLDFVVVVGERIVGVQSLEGEDFPVLRTVDSASHLARDIPGSRLGQAGSARCVGAHLALSGSVAITSAWQHNAASLGVSRALGYKPNGESRHRSDAGQGVETMVHLRLSRADWEATGQAVSIEISGFERCRPLFGV